LCRLRFKSTRTCNSLTHLFICSAARKAHNHNLKYATIHATKMEVGKYKEDVEPL